MRWKWISSALLVGLLVMAASGVAAQSPSVEWDSWNAQITAYNDRSQVDVAETQVINVLDGRLQAGQRDYSQPVDIQSVYFAMNGEQPQELAPGDGAGQYQAYEADGGVILEYQLPSPAQAGDTFVVQINYTAETATPGLIDWYVVPGGHGAPVNSSTVTINFPDVDAPDPSFVRLLETQGSVNVSGNSIVIQSQGVIPADQAFGVQVPFGANVGAPANPNNSNPAGQPAQPAPTGGTGTDSGSGLGELLPILCILGVVILVGGGGLLRNLLGGSGGGLLGGLLGGANAGRGNPLGGLGGRGSTGSSGSSGTSGGRGFRPSANQSRSAPTIKSDKRRGGGASFK